MFRAKSLRNWKHRCNTNEYEYIDIRAEILCLGFFYVFRARNSNRSSRFSISLECPFSNRLIPKSDTRCVRCAPQHVHNAYSRVLRRSFFEQSLAR